MPLVTRANETNSNLNKVPLKEIFNYLKYLGFSFLINKDLYFEKIGIGYVKVNIFFIFFL